MELEWTYVRDEKKHYLHMKKDGKYHELADVRIAWRSKLYQGRIYGFSTEREFRSLGGAKNWCVRILKEAGKIDGY